MKPRTGAQRRYHPGSPFQAQPEPVIEEFAVGDRVVHDTYGLGRVLHTEETAVVVDFGNQNLRVQSPFAKMTKL